MRLTVATNFEPDLVGTLRGYLVYELFGKLPGDSLGGGRASYMLSPLSKRALAAHVEEAHQNGIRFNYLLKCDLMLLVNTNCLQSCPFSQAHMVALSHASQAGHPRHGFLLDYCFLQCARMKLADPVNYIRSDWIRPEDLHHYEALGYDRFKLAERNAPTEVMAQRVKAYSERRYEGNLLDLVQGWGFRSGREPSGYFRRGLFWNFRTFLRPWTVNPLRLRRIRRLAEAQGMLNPLRREPPVVVDNQALDGFLEFFFKTDCHERDCQCRYCHRMAERAVKIDPEFRREVLRLYGEILEDLRSGAMWRCGRNDSA